MQTALDARTIAAQTLLEHRTLEYVKQALRVTINWDVDSVGAERKLSSVKFIADSLHRHLLRLMALEEHGGYMAVAIEEKPHLSTQIETLCAEHATFRVILDELTPLLREGDPDAVAALPTTCERITALLDRIDAHDRRETDLIQLAFCEDEGGEGG